MSAAELSRLRVPPHSREAEQSLLGGLLLEGERLAEVSERLAPGDFYLKEHRLIFEALQSLAAAEQPLDVEEEQKM